MMRVLLVVHGFPPAAVGGTEIYTRRLAHALAGQGEEVFVLTREANPCRPEYSVRRSRDGVVRVTWINNTFAACPSFEDSYANPALLSRAEAEIERIAPDVVHVQHLTCLSTGIPAAAVRRHIPVVMTLNDYWLVCHRGQLLRPDGRRCDGPFDKGCAACLPAAAAVNPGVARAGRVFGSWRLPGVQPLMRAGSQLVESVMSPRRVEMASLARLQHMREAVRDVDVFLAPSGTIAETFSGFGLPKRRVRRCEQGIAVWAFDSVRRAPGRALRAGFAGTLIPSKAPHLLLEAAASLPAGSVEVEVLGDFAAYHGDTTYQRTVDPLLALPFVRRLGSVPHERMAAALADLDVLVVPSVWIENAPFVIREAFAARVPVIASALGGMAEMVRHGVDGLLFTPGDPASLAAQLKRLLDDPSLLARLRAGIRPPPTIQDDAASARQLFRELAPGLPADRTIPGNDWVAEGAGGVCAVVLNYRTPEQTWLAVKSLQRSGSVPGSIVVVDNGPADDSSRMLRDGLDGVEVVETGENLGFPGGCNRGISHARAAGAGFVLLVNSDVVLHPDALEQLWNVAARYPDVGVLAPVLLSREQPDRIASAGIRFSPATGRMIHRAWGRRVGQLIARNLTEVDAVSACVMLVRTSVFDAIGLFDNEYFFSFEDLDFCLRARAAGFRVVCVEDALAYHLGGHSIGSRSPRRVYFATRNHLRLAARLSGSGRPAAAARASLIVGFNLAYAIASPDVPLLGGLAAVARGAWHHLVGRYGPG